MRPQAEQPRACHTASGLERVHCEVRVEGDENTYVRLGDFAEVTIESATEFDLFGRLA